MNLTAGIRELCFMLLFSAVHCIPLPLKNSCKAAKSLNPDVGLLQPYIKDQGFTSEHLKLMNRMLTVDGIPKLNKMASMDKTNYLLEFYKTFKALETYLPTIQMGSNHELENQLQYHINHVKIISNEIQEALVTAFHSTYPTPMPKSDFEKKQFGYKILSLYTKWLDALKEYLC